eukprot:TRINITY_DN1811_c0_g1_i1.p1 TRINITY_DN1811_c0_g1~~TRINITY_DN1811_c0_g1_i1.p1  ORF type:complete len:141 (+),score=30.02 TRINITY_DN1811_c0_g1_i1:35-424(+)
MRSVLFIVAFAVCFALLASPVSAGPVGGVGEAQPADDHVITIANKVSDQVKQLVPEQQFKEYTPISYSSQVVAGMNYFIKISIGNDKYVHIRVYQSFSGSTSLHSVKTGAAKADSITYFDCSTDGVRCA